MAAFQETPEVLVLSQTPHEFTDGTVVRFQTASGPVEVFVKDGRLRATTNLSTLREGQFRTHLSIRPITAHELEIVPGL